MSFIFVLIGFLGYDSFFTAHKETWAFILFMGLVGFVASIILNLLEWIINRRKKHGRR